MVRGYIQLRLKSALLLLCVTYGKKNGLNDKKFDFLMLFHKKGKMKC